MIVVVNYYSTLNLIPIEEDIYDESLKEFDNVNDNDYFIEQDCDYALRTVLILL